ncbi:hypothetical protein GCM10008013_12840 [Paenibacillus segetis]|uniref:DUF2642 domain-containing protein n=1 Tax=Paenibacillus segetis TaxID=1325360 RepID=A0ABQ1Y9K4_9BACL|nr:hypothetical protein GCM10008013_12840 [Paenibacillus segetis]
MDMLRELKLAEKLGHDVVLTIMDGEIILGRPNWGTDPKRVQIKTNEGIIWIPVSEIEHVTRIIPFKN